MGKVYDEITPEIKNWILQQRLFFVATAPQSSDGFINCSPKGADTFRVLGPNTVGYLDITGSGAETIAHVRENGRIVIMFCAMNGRAKIFRFHGKANFVGPNDTDWDELQSHFDVLPATRGIIRVNVTRVSDSCGFGVPVYEFVEERTLMKDWAEKKGPEGVRQYQAKQNRTSIDGLPAIDFE